MTLYQGDTECEQMLIEAAIKAATQDGCPASAAYEIARSIWGIYFESKRKRAAIKQNNNSMKQQLKLLKEHVEWRLRGGEYNHTKREGLAVLDIMIREIGARFK